MNRRHIITVAAVLICLASLRAVFVQQNEIARLREAQASLLATTDASTATAMGNPGTNDPDGTPAPTASPELLRLRSQVTALTQRRRELKGVQAENERLLAQVASSATNTSAFVQGYVRRSDAKFCGYGTPEATMQSLLWAVEHRDRASFLRALEPGTLQMFEPRPAWRGPEWDIFGSPGLKALFGMGIVNKVTMPDGSMRATVQVFPNSPPRPIQFKQINGEWKMNLPF